MSSIATYQNFGEVTLLLEQAGCQYLVLRNFDELLSDEVFMAGHADIDLLCRNASEVAKAISAKPSNPGKADGVHYCINIKGKKASLDLRQVGDGYYCTAWQEDMLNSRIPYKGFYIMDRTNLFYSLVYHAILQKSTLSAEYRRRLTDMARELGLTVDENAVEQSLLAYLEAFMAKNGYTYTYCTDKHVPLRRAAGINRRMIKKDAGLRLRHFAYDAKLAVIDFLVRVKHLGRKSQG